MDDLPLDRDLAANDAPAPGSPPARDVVVVGAGFGGIGLAIRLRQAGLDDFVVLEKGQDVGGVWRDNAYPGAACDVPSHLYSFSFEPSAEWRRRFASQPEILAYLRRCAEKHGLAPFLRRGVEVTGARFDETSAQWEVTTAGGATYRARVLVTACGQLGLPAIPRLPGLERFEGPAFHSARWDATAALENRRVAVIGTGASAVQIVPELARGAARLTVFQRSAPYVLAKPDRPYRPWERALLRGVPGLLRLSRAITYLRHEARVLAFSFAPPLMKLFEWRFRRRLAREVPDAALRARLTPDHPMGCKRILVSNDWYPALGRPNVDVVDARIREVTARGVVTADGVEHPADVIVFGTGFRATEFLAPMRIAGRGGRTLEEAWRGGAEAHLGLQVAGFPNLFLLYGPNTNLGHSSIVLMLESQIRYVLAAVRLLRDRGLRSLDVRPEVQRAWVARVRRALDRSVWGGGCTSWYKTADGLNTNNWPGSTFGYRLRTRRPRLRDQVLDPP